MRARPRHACANVPPVRGPHGVASSLRRSVLRIASESIRDRVDLRREAHARILEDDRATAVSGVLHPLRATPSVAEPPLEPGDDRGRSGRPLS